MPSPPHLEALVPVRSAAVDAAPCLRSLARAGVATTVLVPAGSAAAVERLPGVAAWSYATGELAALAHRCLSRSAAEVVLTVSPLARIHPELPAEYARLLADPAISLAHGGYRVTGPAPGSAELRRPHAHAEDLSEWCSTGYVHATRRQCWLEAGGYDPALGVAQEYDLRLRLGERGHFARLDAPGYEVAVPPDPEARSAWRRAALPWFTPEATEHPGFAYLLVEGPIEAEVERAFEAALRRRGALLDGPCEPLTCPHPHTSPTVTVIIATRDRRAFLEAAVESVLAGSFADFEVVIVDNGSSDGTDRLLEELVGRDPRIRVHPDSSEKSIATAHNLAVAAARGRYVSQLDSDDTYTPDTLARQVAALDRNPDWALAISWYELVDDRGQRVTPPGVVTHDEYDRNTILRTSGAGAVRTWHRCAIEALGGFDQEHCGYYAEDYDLVLKASERWQVGRVPEVLYRCCLHQGNNEKRLSIAERAAVKTGARRRALERRVRRGLPPVESLTR